MNSRDLQRDIKKIIRLLNKADRNLKSAKNLGIMDILGAKTLVSLIKNSKINRADSYLKRAERELYRLQAQVSSLNIDLDLGLSLGIFAKYMDIFKDHTMADIYVQSKIKQERRAIKELKRNLRKASRELDRY